MSLGDVPPRALFKVSRRSASALFSIEIVHFLNNLRNRLSVVAPTTDKDGAFCILADVPTSGTSSYK